MTRTVIDLDDDMVNEAMRIFGTKTKAKAVRLAMEDAVKRHLRQEFFDAMDAGELDFSEIVETTGPRNADGSLKRDNGHDEQQNNKAGHARISRIEQIGTYALPPGGLIQVNQLFDCSVWPTEI